MQTVETRCENCSAEVLSDDLFCQECGERTYSERPTRLRLNSPQLGRYENSGASHDTIDNREARRKQKAPTRQDSMPVAPSKSKPKLPHWIQAVLDNKTARISLIAVAAICLVLCLVAGARYAIEYPKIQEMEAKIEAAEQFAKQNNFQESMAILQDIERKEGKLNERQRACMDLCYCLRADNHRKYKRYAQAVEDLDKVTPAFMGYKQVEQERRNLAELAAQQKLFAEMKGESGAKGAKSNAAPQAVMQQAAAAADPGLAQAAQAAAQANLPGAATEDTNFFSSLKTSVKSTKQATEEEVVLPDQTPVTTPEKVVDETIVGTATDADVAAYNKLLAGYFGKLPQKVVELREPPSFREWMSAGKKDF